MTHICVSKLAIIGSDNGLSPERRQAIIWTNAGILLIGPLGTNFSENLIEILTFSFTKMRLKGSSAKCRPFCLGLNVLMLMTTVWEFPQVTISLYERELHKKWAPISKLSCSFDFYHRWPKTCVSVIQFNNLWTRCYVSSLKCPHLVRRSSWYRYMCR